MSSRIIIIGAGIVGLSIAWQLKRRGHESVTVLEKGSGIGEGSTGASSAVCRYRYTALEMIRLSRAGIHEYRNWAEFVGNDQPLAEFQNPGVLWFTGDPSWADREHERMQGLGIRTAVLDGAADLKDAYPALNSCTNPVDLSDPESHVCGGDGRHLLELDGGYMDPVNAAQDLLNACRGAGEDVRFNTQVEGLRLIGGKVEGVALADGSSVSGERVVNAAGPWCNTLFAAAGVPAPMPMDPVRIQIVYLNRTPSLPGVIPVCVDMENGIYFRSQNRGQQLLVGSVREEDEREIVHTPDDLLRVADDDFKMEKLFLLEHRLPGLQLDRSIRDYCGLYTINQSDFHPVVGPYGPEGFYVANGFSGHGFKAAPAIGAMMARILTGDVLEGEDASLDGWLSPDREPIAIDTRSVLA